MVTKMHPRSLLLLAALLFSCACSPSWAQMPKADAIYVNAKVVTVDPQFTTASAFAVGSGRILEVGDTATVRKLSGEGTRVYDLRGKTVLPGFVDTHPHLGTSYANDILNLNSVASIVRRIGDIASKAKPGEWIVTSPIGVPSDHFNLPGGLAEKRWPSLAELDRAAPNNPLYIPTPGVWPHPALLNSKALQLLGVDSSFRDVGRLRVVRDARGEPTGAIYGLDMYNPTTPLFVRLQSLLPPPDPRRVLDGIRRGMNDYLGVGVTAIFAAHSFTPPVLRQQLEQVRAGGQPVTRIVSAYQIPRRQSLAQVERWMEGLADAQGSGTGDPSFKTQGITASMDGATQFGAAMMSAPYLNPLGQRGNGVSETSKEDLIRIGQLAYDRNLRLHIVLAGDLAGAWAVDALEAINRERPLADRAWTVQHIQHPTKDQIARLKAMNLMVATYSAVDWEKGAATYVARFPNQPALWETTVPLRWWLDQGVVVAQGTDGRHKSPAFSMWASLTRLDGMTGKSMLTDAKRISRREAIEIYTINGARIMQADRDIGSLEKGKLADFVVVDRDILQVPVDQIRTTKVLATVVGGEIVHGSLR
jgi:predicted amidohydrolase YtcJ